MTHDVQQYDKEGFITLTTLLGSRSSAPILPISRATLNNWVRQGRIPAPTRLGPRIVAYPASTVRTMLEQFAAQGGGE